MLGLEPGQPGAESVSLPPGAVLLHRCTYQRARAEEVAAKTVRLPSRTQREVRSQAS